MEPIYNSKAALHSLLSAPRRAPRNQPCAVNKAAISNKKEMTSVFSCSQFTATSRATSMPMKLLVGLTKIPRRNQSRYQLRMPNDPRGTRQASGILAPPGPIPPTTHSTRTVPTRDNCSLPTMAWSIFYECIRLLHHNGSQCYLQ